MVRTRIEGTIVDELKKKLRVAENAKKEYTGYLQNIHDRYEKSKISYSDYLRAIYEKKDGRNIQEWISYLEAYIEELKKRIKEQKKDLVKHKLTILFFSFAIIFLAFVSTVYLQPEFLGFVVQEQIPEAISEANVTVNTTQFQAVIGQPVKWKKHISLDNIKNVTIRLPSEARNITVKKIIKEFSGDITETNVTVSENITGETGENESYSGEINKEKALLKEDSSPSQGEPFSSETNISETKFRITGKTISETGSGFFRNIFGRITGGAIGQEQETIEIEINENATEYEIAYETPAPYAIEEPIERGRGKRIKVIGPENVHYENVLVFTNLPENLNIRNPSSVKIHWIENDTFIPIQNIKDTDNNGIYDYIEFIAPSLSEATFDIIVIIKAEHLNSNREFISDIYEEVKELDGVWSEEIPLEDYIRVTFEQELDNTKDITIYPRVVSGNPRIEIYEVDSDSIIAEFTSIDSNQYNKIFLTNLQGSQDTFDLKVVGGSLEFDYIVDPILSDLNGTFFEGFEGVGYENTGWTTKGSTTIWAPDDTDAFGGTQALSTSNTNGELSWNEINISTSGFTNITFSFYYKTSSGGAGNFEADDYIGAGWYNGTDWINILNVSTTSTYTLSNTSLPIGAENNANFRIRLICDNDHGQEDCFWDNVELNGTKVEKAPVINAISDNPDPINEGGNITITSNVTDDLAVDSVLVEVEETNYTMIQGSGGLVNKTKIIRPIGLGSYETNSASFSDKSFDNNIITYSLLDATEKLIVATPNQNDLGIINNVTLKIFIGTQISGNGATFNVHWANSSSNQGTSHNFSALQGIITEFSFDITNEKAWDWSDFNNTEIHVEHISGNSKGKVSEIWFEVQYEANASGSEIWTYDYNTTGLEGLINYTIYANDTDNNLNSSSSNFTVSTNITIDEVVEDALEEPLNTTLEISNENSSIVYNETNVFHHKELARGVYNVNIKPKNNKIKNIDFNNLNVTSDVENFIDIDNPSDNQGFDELYAVNPLINFTSANITISSSGVRQILKCSDWNFTNRICNGNFTEILNVTTSEYNLTLDSNASAYAEIIIVDAEHLNSSREFISNIYDEVNETDNITYTIPENDYARA